MAIQTRLGQQGIGVRPYAGFIAKTAAPGAGDHLFVDGTRLGQMAIGVRPYAGFIAKSAAAAVDAARILPAAVVRLSAQRVADRAFVNKQSRQTRLPKSEM